MARVTYPKYQKTNYGWLPQIPAHWAIKPLKFAATCNDEALPETTDPDYEFDYVDISSVSLIEGIKQRERTTFEKAPSRARRIVKYGDSIISTVRTYLKAVATIDEEVRDLIVSTGFAVLRPRAELQKKYLGYFVQTQGFVDTVVARSTGVSYPAILASEIMTIPITLPTIPEQEAIVSFLDRKIAHIDALVEKRRRLLDLLEEQRLAVITHAVTRGLDPSVPMIDSGVAWLGQMPAHWTLMKLKFAASVEYGVGGEIDTALTEGINLISLPNVLKNGELDLSNHPYCELDMRERTTLLLRRGDLLFNWRNGSSEHLGKTAIFDVDGDFTHVSFLLRIRAQSTHVPFFLRLFLNGLHATGFFSSSKAGVNNTFNKEELKNLWIMLPPKPEQQQIVSFIISQITRLDGVLQTLTLAIENLQQYRSTLITNAVTGKIDVRGLTSKEAAA